MNIQVLPARFTDAQRRPTGTTLVLVLTAVVAAVVIGAWLARSVFVVAAALLFAIVAYASIRWPRATLVAAIIATLGDPYVIRGLIPSEMHFLITGFSEALVVVVGVGILVRAVRSRRVVTAFRDPVTLLALAFVGVALLSTVLNGVPPLVAALGIFATLDALAVYFLVRMLPFDRSSFAIAAVALVATAVLAAFIGIAQAALTPEILWFQAFAGRFGEGGRVTGFLGNPNLLAALIGFTLPFPLYASRHLASARDRRIAVAVLFVLALALLLTFSRGAWVAVLGGTVIGAIAVDWRVLRVLAVVLVAAYLVAAFMPRNLLVEPDELPPYAQGSGDAPPDFFDSIGDRFGAVTSNRDLRVRFIVEGIPIALDHPLLGVGPGRYGGAVARLTDTPVYDEYETGLYGFKTVHNFWLHTLGEVGVIGVAVFLTLVIGLVVRLVRTARLAQGLDRLLLGATATAAIVVLLHNLTEMLFEGNSPALAIWLLLGLGSLLAPRVPLLGRRADARPAVAPAT